MRCSPIRITVPLFVALWHGLFQAYDVSGQDRLAEIDQSISAGIKYLVKHQDTDGAWRSKTYGLLKDGTSLTPLVTWTLGNSDSANKSRDRALAWMSREFVNRESSIGLNHNMQYPVYAAGLLAPTLRRIGTNDEATPIAAWQMFVQSLQLNEQNGWQPDDLRFGGWGYGHEPLKKLSTDQVLSPLDEPNLSATVFALEALVAADPEARLTHHARRAALVFVERCQNVRSAGSSDDARFNDGGFHFLLGDPVRNKPGVAGIDSRGETRFISYGSATADGLRALILCGVEPSDPRVVAAQKWLLKHFEDGSHPGAYPDERSSLKPSLDYYYAASVAQAFQSTRNSLRESEAAIDWSNRLSKLLRSRQRSDGSWSNPAVDVREDDPFIATSLAVRCLQICRDDIRRDLVLAP